jgi:hypothetical protein
VEAIRLGHYERRAVWLCLINTTVGAANIFWDWGGGGWVPALQYSFVYMYIYIPICLRYTLVFTANYILPLKL